MYLSNNQDERGSSIGSPAQPAGNADNFGQPSTSDEMSVGDALVARAQVEMDAQRKLREARALAETDPAHLSKDQVDRLQHEDLDRAMTRLETTVDARGSATDEEIGVMHPLADALDVMENADFNNAVAAANRRARQQARRQTILRRRRIRDGEDSDLE